MTIEERLIELAQQGKYSITLFANSSNYQANISTDNKKSWSCYMHEDPLTALRLALEIEKPTQPDEGVFG